MASNPPIKTSRLKTADADTIRDMVRIYQEAYKNDESVQLRNVVPQFIERMSETIALRVRQPECEFIVTKTEDSNRIVGWLALAFNLEEHKQLSEEHVLYAQYALIPDIVAKGKNLGIDMEEMKTMAHKVFKDFKETREKQLPGKHCIISTLVVDPEYQNKGVASTLLAKAISLTEVFSFQIWVQAPESCQSLFQKHLFEEIGSYQLDLNEHISDSDDKSKGKGKTKAQSTPARYVWKFMIRKEPLEEAIQAYKSSKVYAEQGAGGEAQELRAEKGKETSWISKVFKKHAAKIGETDQLLGEDVQIATEDRLTAGHYAGADESTPLLIKSSSDTGDESSSKDKAARDRRCS